MIHIQIIKHSHTYNNNICIRTYYVNRLATTYCCMFCMQKYTSVSLLMGARCYKVGIYSFVADNIFFLSNDVNDEMLMLTCGPLPFDE